MIVFFKWGKEKIPTFYLFFRLQSTKKGILSFFRKLPKKSNIPSVLFTELNYKSPNEMK